MPFEQTRGAVTLAKKSTQEIYQILCALLSRRDEEPPWDEVAPTDWGLLVQKAQSEGVAPLVYSKLRGLKPASEMPPAAQEKLKSEYYNTAASNGLLYRELARILEALSQAGIRTIVLKGAVLAADLYEDTALRPMGDLDLLIQEDQLGEAIHVIEGLGYRLEGALRGLNPELRRRIHCEANFQGGEQILVHLEIHWSLIGGRESRYRPDIEWFWEQTEPWVIPGQAGMANVCTLRPTAHLLYLMAHLILKHGDGEDSLRWYYDLHLLIERWGERIDWEVLAGQAKAFHWETALSPALFGIIERFGTPVPPEVLAALPASPASANRDGVGDGIPKSDLEKTFEELADLTWKTRIRLILALIFPSRETILWRYQPKPGWTWPLYYPYRWWGIFKAGAALVFKKLR